MEPQEQRRTFYGSDSFSDFEDFGYQAKKSNKVSRLLLRFANPKWEWSFLNQTDILLKYSVVMSSIVLLTIFTVQALNEAYGKFFYFYTTLSSLLMFLCVGIVWFKKIWDFLKPPNENDSSITVPPVKRICKALYEFSFDIMTSVVWRTTLYLFIVVTLVTVSLLHLVRDELIVRKTLI